MYHRCLGWGGANHVRGFRPCPLGPCRAESTALRFQMSKGGGVALEPAHNVRHLRPTTLPDKGQGPPARQLRALFLVKGADQKVKQILK